MDISVIKIGGNVIDSEENLDIFLKKFADIQGNKILIHGGGKLATNLSSKLNIPTQMIDGRRVTDSQTIDVVTMVYAGLINKTIAAKLQALNCNAIGVSGADAGLIKAVKRNPVPIDFGYVGDIPKGSVDYKTLCNIMNIGLVPVFCSITADKFGVLLNCNADTIAQSIAVGVAKPENNVKLVFCFEKKGILSDINNEDSVISEITAENYLQLKTNKVISDGMIPKVDNAFKALNEGVSEVIIKSFNDLDNSNGTVITL